MYAKQWPELKAIPNETVYQVRKEISRECFAGEYYIYFSDRNNSWGKNSQKNPPKQISFAVSNDKFNSNI